MNKLPRKTGMSVSLSKDYLQLKRMTCCLDLKSQNGVLVQKIFHFYVFVSVDNDTISNFEGYFTCKLTYFWKYSKTLQKCYFWSWDIGYFTFFSKIWEFTSDVLFKIVDCIVNLQNKDTNCIGIEYFLGKLSNFSLFLPGNKSTRVVGHFHAILR